MTLRRLYIGIRLLAFGGNGYKRAEWVKKKGLYSEIGDHVNLPTSLPLYPKLIRIHNNVVMHRSVKLVTHDYINKFLMRLPEAYQYMHQELLTPIEIMDNVYIGMDAVIFGNVRIGPNVIIQAGSVVINDIPSNSVVAGVPAKVVGKLDMLQKTRVLMDKSINYEFKRSGRETIDDRTVEMVWEAFEKKKNRPQRNKANANNAK